MLLRFRRQRIGLTQRALADLANLSVRAVRDLEAGRAARPRAETVKLLADALRLEGRARSGFEAAAARNGARPEESGAPPARYSAIVGRDAEVEGLVDAFVGYGDRLVSVVGLGGVGKTRLALEVAWFLHGSVGWPVLWVDGGAWRRAVAAAMVADVGALAPEPSGALLVLDGADAGAAASLLDEVLDCRSELRVLVTSRARQGLCGERVVPLAPLAVPAPDQDKDVPRLMEFGAVRLLESHIRYLRPGFQIGQGEAGMMAALCRHLDGLPSALRVAAHWALVQSSGQLLDQFSGSPRDIARSLSLVNGLGGVRDTVREALTSLTSHQQALLVLLAEEARDWSMKEVVLRSGWSADECLAAIRELHLRGLVRVTQVQGVIRLTVLNLVRLECDRTSALSEPPSRRQSSGAAESEKAWRGIVADSTARRLPPARH